jgi:hypothetical protein
MKWNEYIRTQPIIQSKYKRKIAAKRRLKVQSGLSSTLTSKDMNQLATDIIKIIKENVPADVEKPATYDDVIRGLKEGETYTLLGFRAEDFKAQSEPIEVVEEVREEVVTEEIPVEQPMEKPIETPQETNVAAEVGDMGRQIAEGFKPLTPIVGPINAPIPAPMPQPYQTTRPAQNLVVKPSPSIGTTKVWDNDISFWGSEKFW